MDKRDLSGMAPESPGVSARNRVTLLEAGGRQRKSDRSENVSLEKSSGQNGIHKKPVPRPRRFGRHASGETSSHGTPTTMIRLHGKEGKDGMMYGGPRGSIPSSVGTTAKSFTTTLSSGRHEQHERPRLPRGKASKIADSGIYVSPTITTIADFESMSRSRSACAETFESPSASNGSSITRVTHWARLHRRHFDAVRESTVELEDDLGRNNNAGTREGSIVGMLDRFESAEAVEPDSGPSSPEFRRASQIGGKARNDEIIRLLPRQLQQQQRQQQQQQHRQPRPRARISSGLHPTDNKRRPSASGRQRNSEMGDDVGDVGRSGYVGAAAVEDDVVSGRVQRLPPALPLEPPPPSPVSPGLGPLAPGHPPLARRHALNVADVEDRSDASSSSPEDGSADLGDIDDDDDKESRNLEPEVKIVPPGMMNGKMRPGKSESYGGNDTRFFEEEFSNRGPQTRRVGEHQRTSSVGPAVVQASARGKRGADRSVMSTPAWAFGSQQPPPRFPVDGLERDRRSSGVESQFQRDRLLHDDLIEEYFDNESGYETRRVTNRPRAAIRQNLTSWPAGGTLLPAAAAAADDDNHHHRQLLMDNKSGTSSSFLHRQNMRDDANNGGRNTDQEDEDFAMGGEAAEMFVGTLNGGRRGEEETPAVFFRSAAAATAAGRPPSSVAEVSAARIHAEKALSDYGGALGDRARFAIHDRRQQHLGDDSQTMSFNGRSESPLGIIEQRRILGGGGGGNASVAHHQYSVPSEIGTVVDQPVGMGMRLVRNPETSSMHSGRMTLLDGAVGGPGAEAEARAKPKKKMEPIRGLEVLDSVNMVELKRVGEEDETKEIQDLRDLSVLHGESSTLRDKFLYKVTYRAADIFCNSSGGFLDPFTVEDYSDAARPASSSAAGDNSQLHVLDDGGGTGDDAKSIAEAVLNHKALFYVTRKLRCVSAVSLGNCTTGYRMRVMDRAGRSVLEIHKPCHFVPPFLRKIVPVSVEAEIFLMNSHQQLPLPQQQTSVGASGGSFKPPTELIGVVKRRWGLGCLPTFTLVNPDGGMVARFKWRGSAGFKIKFCGQGSNGAGQLCLGSDETDMSARTILTYPGDLRGKALLLGASVFLSHYHRVGQTDPSYFASCFCNTMVL